MQPYYYQTLSRPLQAAYHAIWEGLRSYSVSFPVPRLEGRVLGDLFLQVRLDHPMLFYADHFVYRHYPHADHVLMEPRYWLEKKKVPELQKAMESRLEKLVRPWQNLPPAQQLEAIHDFICTQVRYDKLKKPYSHEITGPLGHGIGVCEGMAKTVKALCDALGIWCMVVISGANPEEGVKYRHAWNIVQLNGQYYHLDATFDRSLSRDGLIRYDYFNQSDAAIFRDHEPLVFPAPACTCSKGFYYTSHKLAFGSLEKVQDRALQAMRKQKPLVFYWSGNRNSTQLEQLIALLQQTAAQKGQYPTVRYNPCQWVFAVQFSQHSAQQQICAEQGTDG